MLIQECYQEITHQHSSSNVGTIAESPKCFSAFPGFKAAKELVKAGWLSLFKQKRGGMGEKRFPGMEGLKEDGKIQTEFGEHHIVNRKGVCLFSP